MTLLRRGALEIARSLTELLGVLIEICGMAYSGVLVVLWLGTAGLLLFLGYVFFRAFLKFSAWALS